MTNLQRLQQAMAEKGVEAMMIADADGFSWATGFSGSTAWVILTPTSGVFVTDSRYTLQAKEEVTDLPVETYGAPTTNVEFLTAQFQKLGVKRVGFDASKVTHKTVSDWQKNFPSVEFFVAPELVARLRMVKNATEVEKIRRACQLTDACYDHVSRLIQPGVSELDIAIEIEFYFRRHGAVPAFEPIVVSGERSARPHGRASDKKLEVGDFVTLDIGARMEGYCSDLTRTFVVVEASEKHKEIYYQVLKAEEESIKMMKPGVRCADVDKLSRDILDEKGFAKYYGHSLGHGLGRLVHDSGGLRPGNDDLLEVGNVYTVEPGVYIEGFGGCRIEDDVVVTANGVEVLSSFTKELLILPK